MTRFHPDQNLPGCMMPDGGDCCAGHAAVCDDWHKQRREIERFRAALVEINSQAVCAVIATEGECFEMLQNCARISDAALKTEG